MDAVDDKNSVPPPPLAEDTVPQLRDVGADTATATAVAAAAAAALSADEDLGQYSYFLPQGLGLGFDDPPSVRRSSASSPASPAPSSTSSRHERSASRADEHSPIEHTVRKVSVAAAFGTPVGGLFGDAFARSPAPALPLFSNSPFSGFSATTPTTPGPSSSMLASFTERWLSKEPESSAIPRLSSTPSPSAPSRLSGPPVSAPRSSLNAASKTFVPRNLYPDHSMAEGDDGTVRHSKRRFNQSGRGRGGGGSTKSRRGGRGRSKEPSNSFPAARVVESTMVRGVSPSGKWKGRNPTAIVMPNNFSQVIPPPPVRGGRKERHWSAKERIWKPIPRGHIDRDQNHGHEVRRSKIVGSAVDGEAFKELHEMNFCPVGNNVQNPNLPIENHPDDSRETDQRDSEEDVVILEEVEEHDEANSPQNDAPEVGLEEDAQFIEVLHPVEDESLESEPDHENELVPEEISPEGFDEEAGSDSHSENNSGISDAYVHGDEHVEDSLDDASVDAEEHGARFHDSFDDFGSVHTEQESIGEESVQHEDDEFSVEDHVAEPCRSEVEGDPSQLADVLGEQKYVSSVFEKPVEKVDCLPPKKIEKVIPRPKATPSKDVVKAKSKTSSKEKKPAQKGSRSLKTMERETSMISSIVSLETDAVVEESVKSAVPVPKSDSFRLKSVVDPIFSLTSEFVGLLSKIHSRAWTAVVRDHHVLFCFFFLLMFPAIAKSLTGWTPFWLSHVLWYSFLIHSFCQDGPPAFVTVFRILLPLVFVISGVRYDCILLDLNTSERIVIAFVISGFRSREYVRSVFLQCLAVEILLAVSYGSNMFVQWVLLMLSLCVVHEDNCGQKLVHDWTSAHHKLGNSEASGNHGGLKDPEELLDPASRIPGGLRHRRRVGRRLRF
eukprot:TRINITY_DN3173_c0_g1_i1.p1 TRINITY_DN3173_c0_g1~~TRINITY_DN3173_c0_g1_i1.p1  ORF type:complete len:892 (-),score=216.16 TRINITY_DN3173_c0_g1_i1:67-2742(-)